MNAGAFSNRQGYCTLLSNRHTWGGDSSVMPWNTGLRKGLMSIHDFFTVSPCQAATQCDMHLEREREGALPHRRGGRGVLQRGKGQRCLCMAETKDAQGICTAQFDRDMPISSLQQRSQCAQHVDSRCDLTRQNRWQRQSRTMTLSWDCTLSIQTGWRGPAPAPSKLSSQTYASVANLHLATV